MLPQGGGKWYSGCDAFRQLPKDLAEASLLGAAMTVAACVVCTVLFICEASAFMTSKTNTRIVIDSNEDSSLRINFDVHMMEINCDHVTVGIWDSFGTEKMNVTQNVVKQRIDHNGDRKGHAYTQDEISELEFADQAFSGDELAELDSDWASSSDHFKHSDFSAVVAAHDFTVISFYADWCGHCRQFAPTWKQFEDNVNKAEKEWEIVDMDGRKANVHALRINCVDFEEACSEQKVRAFPTLRLYRRATGTGGFKEFNGQRESDKILKWVRGQAAKRHLHTDVQYHSMWTEGCRLSGFIDAARVPGTVHFQAMHTGEKNLNLAVTNVSHLVHHFSFGEAPRRSIRWLPEEYKRHVNPIDGKSFVVDKFHKAPHHFIKVVHTRFEDSDIRSYQQTHQWNARTLQRSTVPQARFSFDLSPVEVVVSKGDRRWYDFVTQIFAIIGGAFSSMSIILGLVRVSGTQVKSLMNKLN